jgi:aryl-alcohol dehydrogenase-like predicted oxidoreductase
MDIPPETVALGKTEIRISQLGIGAWAWGDRFYWGYGRGYQLKDVQEAFEACLEAGINFFDTAEVYGQGQSEKLLGQFIRLSGARVMVATKFIPLPWRLSKGALLKALRGSLKRLGLDQVELYQIHQPLPPMPVETWAEALADAVEQGLTRAVGVSNYNEEKMRRTHLVLARRGVPLASNQVEYSLLDRKVETNRLLKACQELGVTLIAYSPLAQGVLTGKYTPENPPPGIRGRRYNRSKMEKTQPLLSKMHEMGRGHDGKTIAQVALNWVICKGALPIPGAKNARQARENIGALGWRLSAEEVAALDETADQVS